MAWKKNEDREEMHKMYMQGYSIAEVARHYGKTRQSVFELFKNHNMETRKKKTLPFVEFNGDESRKGLWLYQVVEPSVWARLVMRVNGANTGKMYSNERGNVMGNHTITLPANHTWKSFAESILSTLPPKTAEHYKNKIAVYIKWWMKHGYEEAIPDESPIKLENAGKAPSWRRVCKTLLRNDYWCKYLGFSPTKTSAYSKYEDLMKKRRKAWGIFAEFAPL